MGGGASLAQGSLIKVPEGTGAAFGGLKESPIADGLQNPIALTIKLFKAEGFVRTAYFCIAVALELVAWLWTVGSDGSVRWQTAAERIPSLSYVISSALIYEIEDF